MSEHDELLRRTRLYRNLDWRWSWYGLSFEDLPLIAAPGFLVVTGAAIFGYALSWSLVATVVAVVFVAALKWRKPPGFFERLLFAALMPRRLSSKERDELLPPFPLPPRRH